MWGTLSESFGFASNFIGVAIMFAGVLEIRNWLEMSDMGELKVDVDGSGSRCGRVGKSMWTGWEADVSNLGQDVNGPGGDVSEWRVDVDGVADDVRLPGHDVLRIGADVNGV